MKMNIKFTFHPWVSEVDYPVLNLDMSTAENRGNRLV